MSCITYLKGVSPLHRMDPRAKLLTVVALASAIAFSSHLPTLIAALGLSLMMCSFGSLPFFHVLKRLAKINLFFVMLWIILPLTAEGPSFADYPWLKIQGVQLATLITIKANSLILFYTALLSTSDLMDLGTGLYKLGLPSKLVQLFIFTVRYTDILYHETEHLILAARLRGFKSGFNRHSWQTWASLITMLIIRSLQRSTMVLQAMKCRGFNGVFHTWHRYRFGRREWFFLLAGLLLTAFLTLMEWLIQNRFQNLFPG